MGRADDMLIVQGVNVFPSAVVDVVGGFRPRVTGEIQIEVPGTGPQVQPPVPVRVEHGDSPGDLVGLGAEVEAAIRNRLMFRARVEMVPPGTLAAKGGMKRALVTRD